MKKAGILLILVCLLTGCSSADQELQRGMELRSKILQANECSFDAQIVADYGDKIQSFQVACLGDGKGNLSFSVTAPETITGIKGQVTETGGKLTFDETVLQFDSMADGQFTPVSAPWIFLKTLRSGCLTASSMEEDKLRLSLDDSYEDNALHLDIWLNQEDMPERAEIVYNQRRILSLDVKNFQIL